jgi:hypothetical protein
MTTDICAVCAWRETCQKKFTVSGRDIRCPDFTRDLSLEKKPEASAEEAEGETPKKGD